MRISGELINTADNDLDFLQKFVKIDKIWCSLYDLQDILQSSVSP